MTTEQIKAILDRVLTWPPELQEIAAEVLLDIESEQDGGVYEPSDEEWAAIQEGMEQARRGELVSDEEMDALWKKFEE
jgi:predicted transcriptional regulator